MALQIQLDEVDLAPLVARITKEVVQHLAEQNAKFGGRLGLTEPEAAASMGVRPHVLRDARQRGEIQARRVGKRYIYSREELTAFLNQEN